MLSNVLIMGLFLLSSLAVARNPWLGKQRAAVILLEWNNVAATKSKATLEKTFFDKKSLSLTTFFDENSNGKLDFSGEVLDWRKSSKNFDPKSGCNLKLILNEAKNLFQKDIDISNFDADKNGKIDHLFVIHSGKIPHDRVGPSCTFTSDNSADKVAIFQIEGIGTKGKDIPIGFYLHEAGHGYYRLPDLYGSHYHGRYGIGMWGMMGLGAWGVSNETSSADLFRYPSHFEPKSKEIIGWGNIKSIKKTTSDLTLRPVEEFGDIIKVNNYYLEYRSKKGFSAKHKGHGLLIWKGFTIIQADGRNDINNGNDLGRRPLPPINENFGDSEDPFPGSLNINNYTNTADGIEISNIRQVNNVIKFDITLDKNVKNVNEDFILFPIKRELLKGYSIPPVHL